MPVWDARARAASKPPRFPPNLINVVVVRKWPGCDDAPRGKIVFLTHTAVQQPLQPFDDDGDRSLIENWCMQESKQQWSLQHPPQKTARAVRVHVIFTVLMCALATAYRLQSEQDDLGKEPVGWQRWRRQLLQRTRDKVIMCAQYGYGIFHVAEVMLKQLLPGIGTHQELPSKNGRRPHDKILD
jgi:hypothetical protein